MTRFLQFALCVAAVSTTLTSCNLVKLPGGGASGGSAPHSAGGGGGDGGDAGSGDAASVAAAYQQFTFESCSGDCTPKFRKSAGVTDASDRGGYVVRFNPRSGPNPDPAWLTGWDSLPNARAANEADVVYQALVVAAAAKSWRARCEADYRALHTKLTAADEQMRAAIAAANAKSHPSERLAALHALRGTQRLDDLGFEAGLAAIVGGRYEVEIALVEAARALDREYVYALLDGGAPAAIVERGRPRAELAAELENYCAAAFRGETKGTPGLPQWNSSYLERGAKAVKRPIDQAAVDKFAAQRAAIYADNAKRFAPTNKFAALRSTIGEGGAPKDKLVRVSTESLAVKAVTRSGSKVAIELTGTHKNQVPYGCTRSPGFDNDGRPNISCLLRDVIADRHAVVSFADVDPAIAISPGDHLEFVGKKVKGRETKLVDQPALLKMSEDWVFEGEHLVRSWHPR